MRYLFVGLVATLLAMAALFIGKPDTALAKCQPGSEDYAVYSYQQGTATVNGEVVSISFRSEVAGCRDDALFVEPNSGLNATAYLFRSLEQEPVASSPVSEVEGSGHYKAEFALSEGGLWQLRVLIDGEQIKAPNGSDILVWELLTPASSASDTSGANWLLLALSTGAGSLALLAIAALLWRRRGPPVRKESPVAAS